MVNSNQEYLHQLEESIMERLQESEEETIPEDAYTERYVFKNGGLERVGG
tara:strand:- start:46 stop:195 length:150 start_codon:yes stop_codon:yes gene_type:complete